MPHRFLIVAALFLCAAAASPSFDAMIAINYANPITSFTSSSDCSRSSSSSSFMGVNCTTVRALKAAVRQHPSQNYPLRCASISHSPTTPPCGTTSPWMPSIGPSSGKALPSLPLLAVRSNAPFVVRLTRAHSSDSSCNGWVYFVF